MASLSRKIEEKFGPEGLPVSDALGELIEHLKNTNLVALAAPPGSGKTLLVPTALWEALRFRRVYVLEPRRVTARLPALALESELGALVGYRIRLEAQWDERQTRIGYLTYGTALRVFLEQPPEKNDLVVFDEFHERSWEAELLLTFLRKQSTVPKICLMSATLDTDALPPQTPVVSSHGRLHPVEVSWEVVEPQLATQRGALESLVCERSVELYRELGGEQLIFLPGMAEIRSVAERLLADSVPGEVDILHSTLSETEIRRVVERNAEAGFRRILTTDIAESSITLAGVTTVIDAGMVRRPLQDQLELGLTLRTESAPKSSLTQRAGRAGRRQAGRCHRLFTRGQESHRAPYPKPQISQADHRQVALFLAHAGLLQEWEALPWMFAPDTERMAQATEWAQRHKLLKKGKLSPKGAWVLSAPLSPRTALFAYHSRKGGVKEEFLIKLCLALEDPPTSQTAESLLHWARIRPSKHGVDKRVSEQLRQSLGHIEVAQQVPLEQIFIETYSDTVAQVGKGRAVCANHNQPALFFESAHPPDSPYAVLLASKPRGGEGPRAAVSLYQEVTSESLWECLLEDLQEHRRLEFEPSLNSVRAITETNLGQLVLEREQNIAPPGPEVAQILVHCIPHSALGEAYHYRVRRLELFFQAFPEHQSELETVLGAQLDDTGLSHALLLNYFHLQNQWKKSSPEELLDHLHGLLPYPLTQQLNRALPLELHLPGRRRPALVHYPADGNPYVESKLQDFFGWQAPVLLGGKISLTFRLLAPNGRPCQITDNLEMFWKGSYQQVRKDLRGRYPKHPWPEDPTSLRDLGQKF